MKDVLGNSKALEAIPSTTQATNAAIVGGIIDRANYESVEFLIHASTLTTGAATFTPSLEHGDNSGLSDTTAVDTAAKGLLGTIAAASFTGADDNKVFRLGYAGSKRYLRLTITPASNAANATVEAIALLNGAAFAAGTQASMP